MFYPLLKVGCWCLQLLLWNFLFLPSILSIFPLYIWGSIVRCIYIYNCYSFLVNWLFYHYIRSVFVPCNNFCPKVCFVSCQYSHLNCCLWLLLVWSIFFYLFIFNLFVYLNLKWIIYRQHIVGSCFVVHFVHPYLLVEEFNI